jgi:hypothetical protein
MQRRSAFLLVTAISFMLALAAVSAQKKPGSLLLLDWASKGDSAQPPVAVLIEVGLKDENPTKHAHRYSVSGAKVVHREGYRFREGDKLTDPDGWEVSTHRALRVPPNNAALARTEGIATLGVVLHLADLSEDATLTLEPRDKGEKATVALKDVLASQTKKLWDGAASVRRVTTTTALNAGKTEDDFPAAAYGPDGTLWVAYIGYHLKDESRRVEASQLREQPKDFKEFYKPEFGDQLFVKYLRGGKWSEPIAVTGDKEDLVRCAITVGNDGTALVAYSANRNGRFDLYARPIGKTIGKEQKLTGGPRDEAAAYLSPVLCTGQSGDIHLASQYWSKEGWGGVFHMNRLLLQENGWTAGSEGSSGGASGAEWNIALAAGPNDEWRIACDGYRQGDYDVLLPYKGDRNSSSGGGDQNPVAASSRFEARPSLCYDAQGRLWIAYEEGPENWGKDYGALAPDQGNPLYSERSVRVVCLAEGKLMKPVAELPTSKVTTPKTPYGGQMGPNYERARRFSNPRLGLDGKGRLWLTSREKFGTRYSTHPGSYWLTYARRLDGDKWTEPIEVHHSDGLLDNRPVLLPHAGGGLLVVHNGDNRYTVPDKLQNHVYASYIDLPGEPVEPKLVPHEPGKKDDKKFKEEQAAVKRMRDYRIEAGGKKYQLLRGEFHRHTEMSWDGGPDGSLEDMFRYAIDAAAMDWIGNGDHDSGAGREYSWWLIQKYTDAYHVKDRFTPMFTYERSVAYPHGHRNCMFAKRGVLTLPRLAESDPQKRVGAVHTDDTKMLYRCLKELDGICASHTSATSMGTDWRDGDAAVEPIVEIYQGDRMSYEYEAAPRAGYDPQTNKQPANIAGWFPAGFINHAFEKGYKIGFQSSSDHWSTHISYGVVLAEKHDREGILAALKKRHVYGATDDIVLDVRSGEHIMGDAFKTGEVPALQIQVVGTAPITEVVILRDSKVVETIKPDGSEYKGKWTDPKPEAGEHYYYVRVLQKDGQLAWGSPLWIEYAK